MRVARWKGVYRRACEREDGALAQACLASTGGVGGVGRLLEHAYLGRDSGDATTRSATPPRTTTPPCSPPLHHARHAATATAIARLPPLNPGLHRRRRCGARQVRVCHVPCCSLHQLADHVAAPVPVPGTASPPPVMSAATPARASPRPHPRHRMPRPLPLGLHFQDPEGCCGHSGWPHM